MDIEKAKKLIKELIDGVEKYGYDFTVEESVVINKKEYKAINVLLNELDKKEEDLYEANNRIVDLMDIIDERDKIINEMAIDLEYINKEILDEYDKLPYAESKQKVIDYFTKKVEGK